MNKFTLPTLEERLEYKKQEDEKWKKRIEESAENLWEQVKTSLIKEPNEFECHTIFHKGICGESVDIIINELKNKGFIVKKYHNLPIFDFYKNNKIYYNTEHLNKNVLKEKIIKSVKDKDTISICVSNFSPVDIENVMYEMYLNGIFCSSAMPCAPYLWISKMSKFELVKMKILTFFNIINKNDFLY